MTGSAAAKILFRAWRSAFNPRRLAREGFATGLPGKANQMKAWAVALISMMLVACATSPAPPRTERLFRDHLFAAPVLLDWVERQQFDNLTIVSPDAELGERLGVQDRALLRRCPVPVIGLPVIG